MQSVWAAFDKVAGSQAVCTSDDYVWIIRFFGRGLDLEREGWSESGVTVKGMAKEEVIGLHWVGCKEETADGDGGEVF
jgi:hypothetical protein